MDHLTPFDHAPQYLLSNLNSSIHHFIVDFTYNVRFSHFIVAFQITSVFFQGPSLIQSSFVPVTLLGCSINSVLNQMRRFRQRLLHYLWRVNLWQRSSWSGRPPMEWMNPGPSNPKTLFRMYKKGEYESRACLKKLFVSSTRWACFGNQPGMACAAFF